MVERDRSDTQAEIDQMNYVHFDQIFQGIKVFIPDASACDLLVDPRLAFQLYRRG